MSKITLVLDKEESELILASVANYHLFLKEIKKKADAKPLKYTKDRYQHFGYRWNNHTRTELNAQVRLIDQLRTTLHNRLWERTSR